MDSYQFRQKLARKLTMLRRDAGLSHEEVANALGKKCPAYSAHEEGRSVPSILEMYKLRQLYGYNSIDELLDFLNSSN